MVKERERVRDKEECLDWRVQKEEQDRTEKHLERRRNGERRLLACVMLTFLCKGGPSPFSLDSCLSFHASSVVVVDDRFHCAPSFLFRVFFSAFRFATFSASHWKDWCSGVRVWPLPPGSAARSGTAPCSRR